MAVSNTAARCQGAAAGAAVILAAIVLAAASESPLRADHVRELQTQAVETGKAESVHWGADSSRYSSWVNHTNRLIPVYSFGMSLESMSGANSVYRSADRIQSLYGTLPDQTLNPAANYFDQTDIYHLQKQAVQAGARRIILMVFDGMDWQSTQAAAIVASGKFAYTEGRGTGLKFLDYRGSNSAPCQTDYGWCVTSPHNDGTDVDVDKQTVVNPGGTQRGGYSVRFGGEFPWSTPLDPLYPIGKFRDVPHAFTDSSSSASSMTAGIKTFNNAVNVDPAGRHVRTIAHELQDEGFAIGVVTSVPVSHATPAAAYSHNVSRGDYQDLTRDLLGLKSIAHPDKPLPGVDVLLGAGAGETKSSDKSQGSNYEPGNRYLADSDLAGIRSNPDWHVVTRTSGVNGAQALRAAVDQSVTDGKRLFGYFGVGEGHLPFRTADGDYQPTKSFGSGGKTVAAENYSPADISENPTLADFSHAALNVLSARKDRFWLMIEAGDVDWANHANNIDNSIGATLSGDDAFHTVTQWVEAHGGWQDTVLILTADHGHYLVLDRPELLIPPTDDGTSRGEKASDR